MAFFVACLLVFASLAAAQPQGGGRVRDGGHFFSPQAAADASTKLDAFATNRGLAVVVETFGDPPAELAGRVQDAADNKQARDAAYDQFARARADQINADVLILVTRSPSHIQIYANGRAARAGFSPALRDEVTQAMGAAFRQKQFDQGLGDATGRITEVAQAQPGPAPTRSNQGAGQRSSAPVPTPAPAGDGRAARSGTGSSFSCMAIGLLIVVGFVVIAVIRRVMSAGRQPYGGGYAPGPRYDPQTGQPIGGYGMPPGGYPSGGGFGRGIFGGLLGGLLGGYMADRAFGSHHQNIDDSTTTGGIQPGGGGAFDGGSSGADFGSNDLSSGGDFGGGGGADFGGGDSGGGGGDGGSSGADF